MFPGQPFQQCPVGEVAAGFGYVPQPIRPVVAAAGQGAPIRTEHHRSDVVGVAGLGWVQRAWGGLGQSRLFHAPR